MSFVWIIFSYLTFRIARTLTYNLFRTDYVYFDKYYVDHTTWNLHNISIVFFFFLFHIYLSLDIFHKYFLARVSSIFTYFYVPQLYNFKESIIFLFRWNEHYGRITNRNSKLFLIAYCVVDYWSCSNISKNIA